MREVQIGEVRAGDVARSNGKELRVAGVFAPISLIRCEGDDPFEFVWTRRDLAALGVTFWREEKRALPDYPGAVVASKDGHRYAVRACDRGENFAPWLTTVGVPWKHDPELLDWLGPDWEETSTPPAAPRKGPPGASSGSDAAQARRAAKWMPVDADQIRTGDFARFEWEDGDAVEGLVDVGARRIRFYPLDVTVSAADLGEWFKREARES